MCICEIIFCELNLYVDLKKNKNTKLRKTAWILDMSLSAECMKPILQVVDSLAFLCSTVREISVERLPFCGGSLKERRGGNNILAAYKWSYFSSCVSQLELSMYNTNMEKLDTCCFNEFAIQHKLQ